MLNLKEFDLYYHFARGMGLGKIGRCSLKVTIFSYKIKVFWF